MRIKKYLTLVIGLLLLLVLTSCGGLKSVKFQKYTEEVDIIKFTTERAKYLRTDQSDLYYKAQVSIFKEDQHYLNSKDPVNVKIYDDINLELEFDRNNKVFNSNKTKERKVKAKAKNESEKYNMNVTCDYTYQAGEEYFFELNNKTKKGIKHSNVVSEVELYKEVLTQIAEIDKEILFSLSLNATDNKYYVDGKVFTIITEFENKNGESLKQVQQYIYDDNGFDFLVEQSNVAEALNSDKVVTDKYIREIKASIRMDYKELDLKKPNLDKYEIALKK